MRRYRIEDWLKFGIVLIPISFITLIILLEMVIFGNYGKLI